MEQNNSTIQSFSTFATVFLLNCATRKHKSLPVADQLRLTLTRCKSMQKTGTEPNQTTLQRGGSPSRILAECNNYREKKTQLKTPAPIHFYQAPATLPSPSSSWSFPLSMAGSSPADILRQLFFGSHPQSTFAPTRTQKIFGIFHKLSLAGLAALPGVYFFSVVTALNAAAGPVPDTGHYPSRSHFVALPANADTFCASVCVTLTFDTQVTSFCLHF